MPQEADSVISVLGDDDKPYVSYVDMGGLDFQKKEIRTGKSILVQAFANLT